MIVVLEIVFGDLVLLKVGDQVLVDVVVLEVMNLVVDEVVLIGESEVVEKSIYQDIGELDDNC